MASSTYATRPMIWPQDATAVHRLVSSAWLHAQGRASLHPGDVWWRRALRDLEDFQVWEDRAGEMVGLVEQDPGDASCDIAVHPDHPALERELFLWAEAQARGRGLADAFTVGCFADDRDRHALLASLGYRRTDHHYPHHLRSLERIGRSASPERYAVRALRPEEVADRVELGGLVFEGSRLTVPRYEALRSGPGHEDDLDLVAVDEGGRPVAFCHCWHDPITEVGEFEPVGTHPDHRRRGLARALMEEGLCRLRDRGARQAVVTTSCGNGGARALYAALGFHVLGEDFDYEKPIR